MVFEWDPVKARINRRKHGIAFDDACTVFGDPLALTVPDPVHSDQEERFVTIGRSAAGILLVVVYADRARGLRLISARKATPKEVRSYEQVDR